MICALNYSGRASERGGIIDLVDRRRPSLSVLSVHLSQVKLITRFDDQYAVVKFSPEFRTEFQREVPVFLEVTEFPVNTV